MSMTLTHAPAGQAISPHCVFPSRLTSGLEQKLAQGLLRRVEMRELLFAEGDAATHVYRIETGAIALNKLLSDGRRQVIGFAYPGDLIGLGAEGEHVMNAQAVKPTRVRCLSLGTLRQSIAEDPTLAIKLYEAVARELAATRDLIADHRAAQRRGTRGELLVGCFAPQSAAWSGSNQLRAADDEDRYR
jgi:CRP-like cAMP-binding protein